MGNKLYIGGLSYQTDEETLKNHFAQAGNVTSATIITDKMSGRSKGFGFVEMSTPAEAEAAVQMFNGQEFDGRKITVSEARPMSDRPRTGTGGGFNRRPSSGGGNSRGGFGGGQRRSNW